MSSLIALLGIAERSMVVDVAADVIIAAAILYLFRSSLDYTFNQTGGRGWVGLLWLVFAVVVASRLIERLFELWLNSWSAAA